MTAVDDVRTELADAADPVRAAGLARYLQVVPGGYGEGDEVALTSARCLAGEPAAGDPSAKVHNLIRDRSGVTALIYGDRFQAECRLLNDGGTAGGGVRDGGTPMAWLPGPAALDSVQPRGRDGQGPPVTPNTLYAGRVTEDVRRLVVVPAGSDPIEVTPVNATFLVRVTGTARSAVEVIVYDSRRRELGRTGTLLREQCFVTPAGERIGVEQPGGCSRAVPWRDRSSGGPSR